MTVTVDNASSNGTALEYLKSKFKKWGDSCILEREWSHVRCMAHIMNLIVQDGLKDLEGSIDRIRGAVRWVRLSTLRGKKFEDFAILEGIKCGKCLCLDVPTCWNSTYLMLSVAVEYRNVFDKFAEEDCVYLRELQAEGAAGVPEATDWDNAKRLMGFLRHFYELTLRVSGTKYITSNTYLDSISVINTILKRSAQNSDEYLKAMAIVMMEKFKKYWGNIKNFNFLLFIASVFDPKDKLSYLKVTLDDMYGSDIGQTVGDNCENLLFQLFYEYKRIYSKPHVRNVTTTTHDTNETTSACQGFDDNLFGSCDDTLRCLRQKNKAEVKRKKVESGVTKDSKSELDRYLEEEIEGDDEYFESDEFTVLGWWKKRGPDFLILSLLARDILAIPISTVASESTFSTGGRVPKPNTPNRINRINRKPNR